MQPGRVLADAGMDVTVISPGSEHTMRIMRVGMEEAIVLDMPEIDVAVVQRPIHWTRKHVIRQMRKAGIYVIGEIDDDVRNVHPAHAAFHGMHPRYNAEHNWDHLDEALGMCDRVVCSTPELARIYNGVVVRNAVPADFVLEHPRVHEPRPAEEMYVGWPGKVASHPADLNVTQQAVGRMQRKMGFRFRVIGSRAGVKAGLYLPTEPFEQRWVPLDQYPIALSALDVGICPLGSHRFNDSKSFLKPLELAARGVPFVASPSPEYRLFVEWSGAGLLADGREEWMRQLRALLSSADLRTELAGRGWEFCQTWTVENMAEEWRAAWTP